MSTKWLIVYMANIFVKIKIQIFSKNSNASYFFVFWHMGLQFGILTYKYVYFVKKKYSVLIWMGARSAFPPC